MRPSALLLCLSCACAAPAGDARPPEARVAAFDARFTGATLRFDYVHCGDADEERIAPVGFRVEGEWPGSRSRLVDEGDAGKYRFRAHDKQTGQLLWSRGFCSIYGEWETTAPAKEGWGAFEESQRFPEPRAPARLTLEKRGADGAFAPLWSGEVDPQGRFVDRSPLQSAGEVLELRVSGRPETQVDLLIVAEGYTRSERAKFEADARRLSGVLLETEPFKRHAARFSVRGLHVPSPEGGIDDPRKGAWRDTPFDLSFNAFDSDRYVLTFSDRKLREATARVPYDAIILLANTRKYGGGGIYNLWATVAADTEPAPYVFVHEFGHSFAGLADEYYSSQVAYEQFTPAGVEPWEPNATALLDPARLKWRDLVEPGTPVPTPWDQDAYDALDLEYQARRAEALAARAGEQVDEALMRDIKSRTAAQLATEPQRGRVGAFQGSMYEAKALYRPEVDCIMFSRNPTNFCRVCERALERAIRGCIE
jgi:hypothetical protein